MLSYMYHTYVSRPSNKSISEIKPTIPSFVPNISTTIPLTSPSMKNNNVDDTALERKITLVTEDFTTDKYCELVLKDRNRLSNENALTICEHLIAMKREINPRPTYKKNTIQFTAELSKAVGIEKKVH